MNYYEHHLGDYVRDTAHLSMIEDGAYRRLLDAYYIRESPLPADLRECCKLARAHSKAERDAVAYVLREFFELRDGAHHQDRCDAEVAAYQARVEHNRRVGKKGGRPRKTPVETEPENNPQGLKTEPEQNPPGYFREPEQNPPQTPDPNTSPSLRSGEGAAKPQRPPGRKRSEARTLATYLAECRAAKVKPVPDDHAVRRWAADAGLTPDMLQIAWLQFRDRYTEGEKGKSKRYRDWPAHFATAVKDNWFRLWYTDDKGGVCWSSNGMTHKAVLDARAAQMEAQHDPA